VSRTPRRAPGWKAPSHFDGIVQLRDRVLVGDELSRVLLHVQMYARELLDSGDVEKAVFCLDVVAGRRTRVDRGFIAAEMKPWTNLDRCRFSFEKPVLHERRVLPVGHPHALLDHDAVDHERPYREADLEAEFADELGRV